MAGLHLPSPAGPALAPARTRARRQPFSSAGATITRHARLGETGFGLEQNCLEPLRFPRLSQALISLKNVGLEREDWRKISAEEILKVLFGEVERRLLVSTAVFAGTAQACHIGTYWAPDYAAADAEVVDCRHLTRPMSCAHHARKMPTQRQLNAIKKSRSGPFSINCEANHHPLDVAAWILSSSRQGQHVAVLRFTSLRDFRNDGIRYGHAKEDQIFARTTYWQAVDRMDGDLQNSIQDTLEGGSIIYTSGVGVLRGPFNAGSPWYREPQKIDVVWIAVEPRPQRGSPRHGLQEWYGKDEDRNAMALKLDHAFAWAAARGCDALVVPPIGCGTHGCSQPPLGVANLLHHAAHRYKDYLPEVHVASDHPSHFEENWWEEFVDVLQTGKDTPDPLVLVPPIQLPPNCGSKKVSAQKAAQQNMTVVA